jgi:glycosyltransferase involved in cell wall biosynthesis
VYRVSKPLARERLRLPLEEPVLLFFGIIREYKGLMDLLAAMPIIRQHLEEVWLLIVGEFWDDKEPYVAAIEQWGLDSHTVVTDRYVTNEEAALYFSAADLLVAPYRSVTGSAVVKTASAFGIPVITTFDFGDPVEDGRVTLVEPENVDMLANSVVRYFQNSTQTLHRAAGAKDQASSSWSKTVDEIREVGLKDA